ncbi:MAG TPA: GGDEF domain-containing protein [Kofleriaceae bacterium]|nr:GGDEF domain-containing protein [Kofleriaceae bacterium]
MTDWDDTTTVAPDDSVAAEKPSRDLAYLIVLSGTGVGEMFKISDDEVILGRGSDCDVSLRDDGISREHCKIVRHRNALFVCDLDSRNGTFLNGHPVAKEQLHDGDKIQMGRTTILKFTYHDHLDESFARQMFDSALRDGLTGAYNKRYFSERLDSEIQFAHRHNTPLSLLFIDIDHFKEVNDDYGHLAGDHVLAELSRLIHGAIRHEDVLARYGGDELAIILRAISLGEATLLGDRLRKSVSEHALTYGGASLEVTISVGVACTRDADIESDTDLIAAADDALYRAKQAGRNQVIAHGGERK